MRLSEIRGDRCLDVIADLVDPIARIAEDETAMEAFRPKKAPDGMTPHAFFLERIKRAVPSLVRDHKSDLILILSVIEGVTPEEYTAALTMPKLLSDAFEILTDRDLIGFLASANTTETPSGPSSPSTVDPAAQTSSVSA